MKSLWGHYLGAIGLSRFLQWRFNTFLVRWLPFAVSRAYLSLLGRVYYLVNATEREQIIQNLVAVLRRMLTREPVELIVRRTFQGVFAHYYEKLFMAYARFNKVCRFLQEHVQLEDQHLLDEALSHGRGLILVTGHFGAVEFLPLTLALKGYPVTMVVRFKTERLKRVLNQRAETVPITLLDAAESEGVLFSALQALKANEILITECDEFDAWRPDRRRSVQFLGCPSPLDRSLDLLQRRYRSPVIMGFACRGGKSRYDLRLHPLVGGNGKPGTQSVGQRALQILEQYIYEAPDQWYQWRQVRTILGTSLFEETRPILAAETDRPLSVADSVVHVYQA